jgi:hypothetical protein
MSWYKDPGSLEAFASWAAGNWKRWTSCSMSGAGTEDDSWFFFEPEHRDSEALDRSNTVQIKKRLRAWEEAEEPDVVFTSVGCWAYGWRTQIRVRVYRDGCITAAAKELYAVVQDLEDNPILDESHLSELENEEWVRGCEEVTSSVLRRFFTLGEGQTKEEVVQKVLQWLQDDGRTDTSEWPDEELIVEALIDLGYAKDED